MSASATTTGAVTSAKSRAQRARWLNLGSFLALLAIWFVLTTPLFGQPLIKPLFLPSPASVGETFMTLLKNGYQGKSLLFHIGISLFRFGLAFVLSLLVAVPLGLWMGMNESVKAVLDPPIEITRPMPKLALLPLLIIWFGIGEVSKILIIVLALFPILSISAMQAVRGVGARKIQAALALGASRTTIFRRVIFPASLPGIFTSIRVSIGLGVTMLVGAELIATTSGIAFMAMSASDFLLTNVVIVGVLIMALIGYVLDLLARAVENRVVHWGGKEG